MNGILGPSLQEGQAISSKGDGGQGTRGPLTTDHKTTRPLSYREAEEDRETGRQGDKETRRQGDKGNSQVGNTAYEGTRVRMYEWERNRISNIERPTLNVEVTRLSAEDGITTDQQDHKTTGLRTTDH